MTSLIEVAKEYMKDNIFELRRKMYYECIITSSQSHQLPDGLITQLVDHCTAVLQRSWVRVPVQVWIIFRLKIHNCITMMINQKFEINFPQFNLDVQCKFG